ncbi:uncharacterized protein [Amphiura filiformis]|uniref:uncharacterized protein isoform X2 n=1 Tax=Amphiura filiformis TaxID=82378 RepID=UPI003B21DFEC
MLAMLQEYATDGHSVTPTCTGTCSSWLKMGLAPSFPIEMEPVSFEPNEFFSSTGTRRIIGDQELRLHCQETSFHQIHEQIYKGMIENRRKFQMPKEHLEVVNFDELCRQHPRFTPANVAEFRIEFIQCDIDKDALLDFNEICNALDRLGDNSEHDLRYNCYTEAMTAQLSKVDFRDFLVLCELICQSRDEMDACALPYQISREASPAKPSKSNRKRSRSRSRSKSSMDTPGSTRSTRLNNGPPDNISTLEKLDKLDNEETCKCHTASNEKILPSENTPKHHLEVQGTPNRVRYNSSAVASGDVSDEDFPLINQDQWEPHGRNPSNSQGYPSIQQVAD